MGALVENLIRHSDNPIVMTLTSDGELVSGNWNELEIFIGPVEIFRSSSSDGVTLDPDTGVLTITPGDLTQEEKDALDELSRTRLHRVVLTLITDSNDDGAVFGGAGSTQIYFRVTNKR